MRPGSALVAAVALSAALTACSVSSTRYKSSNVLPIWVQPEAPTQHPSGMEPRNPKFVIPDGMGGYTLPDGSRAASDKAGGFFLPNGQRATADGFGGVRLPNGNICTPNPGGGFACP